MEEIPRLRKNILAQSVQNSFPSSVKNVEAKNGELEIDPVLKALLTIDWSDSNVLANESAIGAIERLVEQCHPSVLQLMVRLLERRIRNDFRLFMNMQMELETLRKLKELGDYTYLAKTKDEDFFW